MFRFLLISNSPLVSVIVWPLSAGAKLSLAPGAAALIASRNEPGPESFGLMTVKVAASAGKPLTARRLRATAAHFNLRIGFVFIFVPFTEVRRRIPAKPVIEFYCLAGDAD